MAEEFHWRHARDSLLTPWAIQLFQILATKDGQSLAAVKDDVDREYLVATGRAEKQDKRHGGKVQTAIAVYREAGWVTLEDDGTNSDIIKVTDAGQQALLLFGKLPDFLKAVPHFITTILGRYQLNNPARPGTSKDPEYDELLADSDIFPYWTLFKVMRSCDNRITTDELRRFVFQLRKNEDLDKAIAQIKKYRVEKEGGASEEELNKRYPEPLAGAVGEPKYIMGRLGTQVGTVPPIISKEGQTTYVLNPAYDAFVDQLISSEPRYEDYLTEEAWMAEHGKAIEIHDSAEAVYEEPDEIETDLLPDDDPIWIQLKSLLDAGTNGVLLSGPPGTSKTWYAGKLALKVTDGHKRRIKHIQFHPSYAYEEFVEGYVPVPGADGFAPSFEVQPKLFLRLCDQARRDPDNTYVLIVDEFSRGDPSRILGEVLTFFEQDYRNRPFTLPYSGKTVSIPPNILMIGTMNPYDKSVADLDDAMERRFDRIAMDPSIDILKMFLADNGASGVFTGKIIDFFKSVNEKSPHGFGHTFFLRTKDEGDLRRLRDHSLRFVFDKMFPFEPELVKNINEELMSILAGPESEAKSEDETELQPEAGTTPEE